MRIYDPNGTEVADEYRLDGFDFSKPDASFFKALSNINGNFDNGVDLTAFAVPMEILRKNVYSLFDHLPVESRRKVVDQWRKAIREASFNGRTYAHCLMGQVGIALEMEASKLNMFGLKVDPSEPREAVIFYASGSGAKPAKNFGMYILDTIIGEYQTELENRRQTLEAETGVENDEPETAQCAHCGATSDVDDMYDNDETLYCNEDCYLAEEGYQCEVCDEYQLESLCGDSNLQVCESCHDNYVHCENCETLVSREEVVNKRGNDYCSKACSKA